MKFIEYSSGLYYYDAKTTQNSTTTINKHSKNNVNAYLFLNTVSSNKNRFTQQEIEGADEARSLYRKLGHPSEVVFQQILSKNLIQNCPITVDDAKRALHIYGPDIATLKGKTTKKQNSHIPNYQPILIPAPIIAQYTNNRLFIDIFWVCGYPFFHTISEWIKFRTVALIPDRKQWILVAETKAIINMYTNRGLHITRVEGDNEFCTLENDILPVQLNIADADDHVPEVERSIRTLKERVRCLLQGLPYRRVPKVMIRAAIEYANRSLNQIPVQNSASDHLSPLTIMTGRPNVN